MKKNVVFTALLCALTMVFALSLGSCSDGDDGGSSSGSATTAVNLAGRTYIMYYNADSATRLWTKFVFASDGTLQLIMSVDGGGQTTQGGIYTVSGTTVSIKPDGLARQEFTYNSAADTLTATAGGQVFNRQ